MFGSHFGLWSVWFEGTVVSIQCAEQSKFIAQNFGIQACYLSRGFKRFADSQIAIMHEETDKTQVLHAYIHM